MAATRRKRGREKAATTFAWLGDGRLQGGLTWYRGFRADSHYVTIGDVVLLDPGDTEPEPYVGWVVGLFRDKDGSMMMRAQWFFRSSDIHALFATRGKRSPGLQFRDNELALSNQVRSPPTLASLRR